jgi:hypothetical protein
MDAEGNEQQIENGFGKRQKMSSRPINNPITHHGLIIKNSFPLKICPFLN